MLHKYKYTSSIWRWGAPPAPSLFLFPLTAITGCFSSLHSDFNSLVLSPCGWIHCLPFVRVLPDDIRNLLLRREVRGLAGEPGAFAVHLRPTFSHILSPLSSPLSIPACVSLPHKPLCLVFKSIHHPCE